MQPTRSIRYDHYQNSKPYKPVYEGNFKPGRMKRLNAHLKEDPEFAAQHAARAERMKTMNAKSASRRRPRLSGPAIPDGDDHDDDAT